MKDDFRIRQNCERLKVVPVRVQERPFAACDKCANGDDDFRLGGIMQVYEEGKKGMTLCAAHWEEYAHQHKIPYGEAVQ